MDLIYVSYNSEKWIDGCFDSLMKSEYNLKDIFVYVVDNASKDNTVKKLEEKKEKIEGQLGKFEIIRSTENLGFGKANNLGFSKGNSEIVCFFNIDTELYPDTLTKLEKEIYDSSEEVGLWELRQFPYEHPKRYDILTGYTTWCSGAAFAMKRELYARIGGFDERIFMYAEDVDLSWRIRSLGYKLRYVPKATLIHYSYENAGEVKPNQYINSIVNNLLLRYRFGTLGNVVKGHMMFWGHLLKHRSIFPKARRILLKRYIAHFKDIPHFMKWRNQEGNTVKGVSKFAGWDYEMIRDGAFHKNERPETNPLVSIIVRTCNRPKVLRECLISLRHQTYENIEIVVVEDGKNTAEEMIREEFSDLNIIYQSTGKNVGRSKAGNTAMSLAHGKYLNFLDDDDMFYADHVETLVRGIERSNNRAIYSTAFEVETTVESKDPYVYTEYDYKGVHKQPFSRPLLYHHNYIPIQCIMFEKTLFDELGGQDERLDALEDWDMWVRYATKTDFDFIFKTTSLYRVPYQKDVNAQRQKALDDALVIVREKHSTYETKLSVKDVVEMMKYQF